MKTFRFQGKREYIEYFTIDVEAESLEEAQEMIDEGEYDEEDHWTEFIGGSDEITFIEKIEI